MPCDYSKYPANWKEIRARILERAGHKCEQCGVANYAIGARSALGHWIEDRRIHAMSSEQMQSVFHRRLERTIRIVLTIAHVLNPDPMDCRDENLQALCQRCHNRHDAKFRAVTAKATRLLKTGQSTLTIP